MTSDDVREAEWQLRQEREDPEQVAIDEEYARIHEHDNDREESP